MCKAVDSRWMEGVISAWFASQPTYHKECHRFRSALLCRFRLLQPARNRGVRRTLFLWATLFRWSLSNRQGVSNASFKGYNYAIVVVARITGPKEAQLVKEKKMTCKNSICQNQPEINQVSEYFAKFCAKLNQALPLSELEWYLIMIFLIFHITANFLLFLLNQRIAG